MKPIKFNDDLPQVEDFLSLFLNDTPLLDVRAPIEFAEGAFPLTENHPLMNDDERHHIGIQYKNEGQDAAVELGMRLLDQEKRHQRIAAWQSYVAEHPEGALYCFRGGMRSKITQQWLHDHGIDYPRVTGGYKALRRFLIGQLEENAKIIKPVVIGGRTGVGKTRLLNKMTPNIDLEGIAWHRGSAFGRHVTPQPSQIGFENSLSIEILKVVHQANPYFVTEDESRNIGIRHMPDYFYDELSKAPILVLDTSLEERIEITLQEYVHEALAEHQDLLGHEAGFEAWDTYVQESIDRIQKRLGGVRYQEMKGLLVRASVDYKKSQKTDLYRDWIRILLEDYYDSMYGYQLEKKQHRVTFTGSKQEVCDYLASEYDISPIRT